jgi:hypothetical protein
MGLRGGQVSLISRKERRAGVVGSFPMRRDANKATRQLRRADRGSDGGWRRRRALSAWNRGTTPVATPTKRLCGTTTIGASPTSKQQSQGEALAALRCLACLRLFGVAFLAMRRMTGVVWIKVLQATPEIDASSLDRWQRSPLLTTLQHMPSLPATMPSPPPSDGAMLSIAVHQGIGRHEQPSAVIAAAHCPLSMRAHLPGLEARGSP